MIFPCIDLMAGKVVQLVQGRDKALQGGPPEEMLDRFRAFPEIQVIDLDAALGRGANDGIVEFLARRARCRIGGGVRSVERASRLIEQGAWRVIVGTAAFAQSGIAADFLSRLAQAVGSDRVVIALDSRGGKIVVKGWRESLELSAEQVLSQLEPYCSGFLCTYVDKEGMMQGTDLGWFRRLRRATDLEITAAGGITSMDEIAELQRLGIHAALGMAIYTGRLDLDALARLNTSPA
jgi:phosphoribosylformimino-5-aminoimidazole carboxamide ribotide isomerase